MAGSVRIPRAEIRGLYGAMVKRFSRRLLGSVPEPLGVYWHHPAVLRFSLGLGQKSGRWRACDKNLKSFAHMAVASLVGCSWCLDFGYFMAHNEGLDLAKAREVPRWRARREDYVGAWLPEPLLTSPDAAQDVELAESLSIAMLTVLETLGPTERAVFVLREVFDAPYDEIAAALDKTPAAVRQIAHRARAHVAARRPRLEVDRAEQQRVVERFLAALSTGDVQSLMDVLAPDVVLIADGGGVAQAVRHPIEGHERVSKLLAGFRRTAPEADVRAIWLNASPAIRIDASGGGTTAVSLVIEAGRISRIYAMRNPQKLARLDAPTSLAR